MTAAEIKHARRRALSLAVLIAFQFSIAGTASPAELQPKRVLILFAVNVVLPTHMDWERGIRSGLQAAGDSPLEIDIEYADLLRFKDENYTQSFVDLLRHKYSNRKVDVVIPVYDPAFEFIGQHEELFPGAAVVFCSVDEQSLKDKKLAPNVTGVPMRLDFAGTVELAHQLMPRIKRLAVVAGVDVSGRRLEAEAKQVFANDSSGIEFKYFSGTPLIELKEQLSRLPSDTAILLLPFVQDVRGTSYSTPEVASAISAVTRAPIFSVYDTLLGHGVIGGHLVSLQEHGKRAGEMAARILRGERPSQIPVAGTNAHRYEFDWRELRRCGISEASLPAGSVVLFRQPTFWELYKWYVIGGFGIVVAQSLAIAGLLASRRRRRQAERDLTEHLDFSQSLSALSAGFLKQAPDEFDATVETSLGMITEALGFDCGAVFEFVDDHIKLFATPFEGVVGLESSSRRTAYDASLWCLEKVLGNEEFCFSKLEELPAAARRETDYCRQIGISSGIVLPLAVSGSVIGGLAFGLVNRRQIWSGTITERLRLVATVFVRAIARRRADETISVGEKRVKDLAGRLLTAQEEERRHLARELHDDVTQRLAMAAIEIDKVERGTTSTDDTTRKLGIVKQNLVQLSEDVHSLSRQLHPQIIEDLGLVAALRVECDRFFDRQGIQVEFDPVDVPAKLPRDIALCAYRVAQEGLWNIAKHAQTAEASLVLRCDANRLFLRIADAGIGFDSETRNGGLGLVGMAERVNLFKGKMTVNSHPGAGTQLDIELPIASDVL